MVIWMLFGVLASVVAGLTGFVTWRDRRRSPAAERILVSTATQTAYRHDYERHPEQGGP